MTPAIWFEIAGVLALIMVSGVAVAQRNCPDGNPDPYVGVIAYSLFWGLSIPITVFVLFWVGFVHAVQWIARRVSRGRP